MEIIMNPCTDKLYKLNSNGSIQVWWAEIDPSGMYRTCTGKVDGKIVTSEWTVCVPKNVGKKNETTAIEQANKQVASLFQKQIDKSYKTSIDYLSVNDRNMKPMLAEKFEDRKDYVISNLWAGNIASQPKLDGIRCIVSKDGMFTRNSKPIYGCNHIFEALKPAFVSDPDIIFDGELYSHSLKDDFPKIVSLVKKEDPSKEELEECKRILEYHIYDCFGGKMSNLSFVQRFTTLCCILEDIKTKSDPTSDIHRSIIVVPTEIIETHILSVEKAMDKLMYAYIEDGYEGQMLRIANSKYENKRTKNLLKRKEFDDIELPIVNVLEGIGNRSNMAGKLCYIFPNGESFETGIRGNYDIFRKIWNNKKSYIGKLANVRYFGLTPDGKPRFGVTTFIWENGRDV